MRLAILLSLADFYETVLNLRQSVACASLKPLLVSDDIIKWRVEHCQTWKVKCISQNYFLKFTEDNRHEAKMQKGFTALQFS